MFNKRMVFMAGPGDVPQQSVEDIEGAAGAKKKLEGFMPPKAEELQGGVKPEVKGGKVGVEEEKIPFKKEELDKLSKGYPEVTIDGTNKGIVEKIKSKFVADNEKDGRGGANMVHKDNKSWADNNKPPEYVLVYDELHTPPERLFKENLISKIDPIDAEVKATFKLGPVTELTKQTNPSKKGAEEIAMVKQEATPLPTKDGESWLSNSSQEGYKYLLIRDDRKVGDPYRIFKGRAV